jgi:hypothetical protein
LIPLRMRTLHGVSLPAGSHFAGFHSPKAEFVHSFTLCLRPLRIVQLIADNRFAEFLYPRWQPWRKFLLLAGSHCPENHSSLQPLHTVRFLQAAIVYSFPLYRQLQYRAEFHAGSPFCWISLAAVAQILTPSRQSLVHSFPLSRQLFCGISLSRDNYCAEFHSSLVAIVQSFTLSMQLFCRVSLTEVNSGPGDLYLREKKTSKLKQKN